MVTSLCSIIPRNLAADNWRQWRPAESEGLKPIPHWPQIQTREMGPVGATVALTWRRTTAEPSGPRREKIGFAIPGFAICFASDIESKQKSGYGGRCNGALTQRNICESKADAPEVGRSHSLL